MGCVGFGEENRRCRAPAPAPSASECHWRVLTRRRASPPIYFGASVQPLHPSVGDERTASAGICVRVPVTDRRQMISFFDEAEAMQLDFAAGQPLLPVPVPGMHAVGFALDDFDFGATPACDAAGFHFGAGTATCGGAAGGSGFGTCTTAGGAEDEEERLRRLKRKISNRESARRSRARRRQRAEELGRAAEALRAQRRALAARSDAAAARALAARLDNARLQAEARALRRRLGVAQRQAVLLLALARARLARAQVGTGAPVVAVPPPQQPQPQPQHRAGVVAAGAITW